MKFNGIVRKVDNLGRIVIPIEMRRILDINEGDIIEINQNDKVIFLKKHYTKCVFCGSDKGINRYKGIGICSECIKYVKEKY